MTNAPPPVVAVVFHRKRRAALELANRTLRWCSERGIVVALRPGDADQLDTTGCLVEVAEDFADSSIIVAIGGDGTMLRAVHAAGSSGVPVVGVNVGFLGYLTHVEPDKLFDVLNTWIVNFHDGTVDTDERMLIEMRMGDKGPFYALNEIVFEKEESGHTVRLTVSVAGSEFTTYVADGLILATPTGSTAYSLSARGPILSPRLRALLLTPVSPHMLFDRSLVLHTEEEVEVAVTGQRNVNVVADGSHIQTLTPGARVAVKCSSASARLLRVGDQPFHQVLRQKFGLADR